MQKGKWKWQEHSEYKETVQITKVAEWGWILDC